MALEHLRVAGILVDMPGPSGCSLERIPMREERSITLGGRVEARDHGGWVFTCTGEAGDRARYFRLAAGVSEQLSGIDADFVGGTSYAGQPNGTLETRWTVRGEVLTGEIELLTVPSAPGTLTMIVLIDLRGTWQGQPPTS